MKRLLAHWLAILIAAPLIAPPLIAPPVIAAPSATRTPLTVADLHKLAEVSEPVFAPDGGAIAYTVAVHDQTHDKVVSHIWLVPWRGGPARQLTRSLASEWSADFSKDGRTLAYLSDAGKAEETQLWMQPLPGGKARQVTHIPGGISDYSLSPDGQYAAIIAEVGRQVGQKPKTPAPIVISRYFFKEDKRDYLDDRRQHLFIVDVATGAARQRTTGDFDHWLPNWSPDGRWISFVSKRGANADRTFNFDVFITTPGGTAPPRQISRFAGADSNPGWEARPDWSPDSHKLVWLQGGEDKGIYYAPFRLAVADIVTGVTSAPARIDRWFYKPRWSPDGKWIETLIEQDRDTLLARVDPSTGGIAYQTEGARFASDFAVGPGGQQVVLDSDTARPAELIAVEGNRRPLTNHNPWLASRQIGATQDMSFVRDGTEIHGQILLPPGARPGVRLPTIVRLHGGPVYQFSHEFMLQEQIYAASGYAVVMINPHGSSGRGFDFARAIYADWGNADVLDIKAGVDAVIASGIADPERLGVGGWSYGGILTDYMIASDTRFKAAVSGAGLGNVLATYGTDQYAREYEFELGTPWHDSETYRKLSYPFLHADRIKTPTLFQCASKDFNVPCIGAEQMYQALQSNNVQTGLVIYPEQNHSLTKPSYLADRLRRNIAWYDRYLKGK
jgi:dipeptidyl aminopeptidase/acylaminoacyl peptidase